MMSNDMQKIREVKRQQEKNWMAIDGVVAVGIGQTSGGEAGIIISVSKNLSDIRSQIPGKVRGIPIEINETGEIIAR
jgi:hypothetical protein